MARRTDCERHWTSRRTLLSAGFALAGLAASGGFGAVRALEALAATPRQTRGPFYPTAKPLDQDNDLASVAEHSERAEGQLLHVMGRVMDSAGTPLPGATIEIWQTNAAGRYHHERDRSPAPLDPDFQGYGTDRSDQDGGYRFRTVKPAPYRVSERWTRPAHIHFAITRPGLPALVTQMYFAGDPYLEADHVLNSIADAAQRQSVIITLASPRPELEPDSLLALFDIVFPA